LGMAWFAEKQRHMKNRLSAWQMHHGSFSYTLPLSLVLLLIAMRYGWIGRAVHQIKASLALRGKNADAASSQIASRMYIEMVQIMGRHGYSRTEAQTPFEFAAVVKKPTLGAMVEEFTALYSAARYGGAVCNIPRLQRLLGAIRTDLRTR